MIRVTATLLFVLAALAGCAASRPGTNALPTLADLDRAFAGEAATVVLLDSSRFDLRLVEQIGPDSIAGVREDDQQVALSLGNVAWLEIPGTLGRSRRGTCLALSATPLGCAAYAASGEAGAYVEPDDPQLCALGAVTYTAACVGLALLVTDPPRPVVIPIAPLSQFEDAPRQGVGLR